MAEEFDFVVVGAGSAGCAVAARLSEDGEPDVLLAEARVADADPLIRVPMGAASSVSAARSTGTWRSRRRRTWTGAGRPGSASPPRSTARLRGLGADGAAGLGLLKRAALFQARREHAERRDAFHGADGPLRVTKARRDNALHRDFLAAAFRGAGARPAAEDDFDGAEQQGLALYDYNIRTGRRESAATAYPRLACGRRNLEIRTGALARHVVIEEGRSVGGAFRRNGREEVVRARREVILCGGAVATPGLLERSGVGYPEVLRAAGIPLRLERPAVGAHCTTISASISPTPATRR